MCMRKRSIGPYWLRNGDQGAGSGDHVGSNATAESDSHRDSECPNINLNPQRDLARTGGEKAERKLGALAKRVGRRRALYPVVLGRRRRCEVVDAVNLHVYGNGDIVEDELEVGVADPVLHVVARAGVEVVEHGDLVPLQHERVHQVRAHEPRAPCYQDAQPSPIWQLLDWPKSLGS